MKSKSSIIEPLSLLQIALAIFFSLSGLSYLLKYDTAGAAISRLLGNNDTLMLIVAIVELAAGIILLAGLFAPVETKYMYLTSFVILILWAVNISTSYFINNLFKPDFIPWLQGLSLQLIILAGLWGVTSRYSK